MPKRLKETERFLRVVKDLRKKCPWDKKQTHKTLEKHLIEEAYEVIEAIQAGDKKALREELGDLLLQIALHSEIASEKKYFDFDEVAGLIADKMIRRHPHIYGKHDGKWTYEKHLKNWNRLKAEEKPKRKSLLDGVPKQMPGLQLAQKYGEKAATVGFDWQNEDQVWAKVEEEIEELQEEMYAKKRNRKKMEEEFGDLLFSLGQLARHLKIDAEMAAIKAAFKFRGRFQKMESHIQKKGHAFENLSFEELDALWESQK